MIIEFEEKLDSDHEIGARLVSFGESILFSVLDIGYYGPDVVVFYGSRSDGERLTLIQHVTQLNVLLIAQRKLNEKPVRIGFKLSKE